jgi:two-component system LytT family response regulator
MDSATPNAAAMSPGDKSVRLRAIIVDDEPLAREGMADLLALDDEVDVVGMFDGGQPALDGVRALRPDVLFLDVQMPEMNGFELLRALGDAAPPVTIFVTAYDRYAVQAFEVNAVDYLLKPVEEARLHAALAKAKRLARGETFTASIERERLLAVLERVGAGMAESGAGRIIVRDAGRIQVVRAADVGWVEGAGSYVKLHVGGKSIMHRETLASLEARLDARRFLRVHRSAIVNLAHVRAVESHLRGDGVLVLHDGTRLRVLAARRTRLETLLEDLHE